MGAEAAAVLRWRGKAHRGVAHLEHDGLLFRGPVRVRLGFDSIRSVRALDGVLRVAAPQGPYEFHLGAAADRWAQKIRNPKPLLDKLGITAESRVHVDGVADADFLALLRARTPHVAKGQAANVDVAFVGVDAPSGLRRIQAAKRRIHPAGAVWAVSPRGVPRLKDTDVMAAGKAAGLVDVKVVRFSATHTANKFVVPVRDRPAKRGDGPAPHL